MQAIFPKAFMKLKMFFTIPTVFSLMANKIDSLQVTDFMFPLQLCKETSD